jgi:predicted CXXCH cytochrome family protein
MTSWIRTASFILISAALVSGCDGGRGSEAVLSGFVRNNHTAEEAADRGVQAARVILVDARDVEDSASVSPLSDLAGSDRGYPETLTDEDGHYLFSGDDFSDDHPKDAGYFPYVIPPENAHLLSGGSASRTSLNLDDGSVTRNIILSDSMGPNPEYIGSSLCLICHRQQSSIKRTLHFVGIRKLGPGGTITNGLMDFTDTVVYALSQNNSEMLSHFTDPATEYTFADQEDKSFWLGRDGDGFFFRLTTETGPKFYVKYTYGGETGLWRGLFLTTVSARTGTYAERHGSSGDDYGYFVFAPFQYNEDPEYINGERFVAFRSGQWDFSGSGNIGFTAEVASFSFDLNCSACHGATGIETVNQGSPQEHRVPVYIPDGEGYVMDGERVQVNVGCERCHGPGSNHLAAGGNGQWIIAPAKLTAERSAMICGSCHIRGNSPTAIGGGAPVKAVGEGVFETFPPGMPPSEFFGTPDGTGRDVSPFGTLEIAGLTGQGYLLPANLELNTEASWTDKIFGTEFNHSKTFRQHYMDLVRTAKFANLRELQDCSSCHSPHGSGHRHMTTHSADNNAVCLGCHSGENRIFPDITDEMVARLRADKATAADISVIGEDVEAHIYNRTGTLQMAPYDPEGTAMGRCTLCHMPKTAKSAAWRLALRTNLGRYIHGDIASHTFDVMQTEAVNRMAADRGPKDATPAGISHECGDCHAFAGLF